MDVKAINVAGKEKDKITKESNEQFLLLYFTNYLRENYGYFEFQLKPKCMLYN